MECRERTVVARDDGLEDSRDARERLGEAEGAARIRQRPAHRRHLYRSLAHAIDTRGCRML
jgi:hypothetical protein